MKAICEGRKSREEVVSETIEQYLAVYTRTQQRLNVLHAVSWIHSCIVFLFPADFVAVRPQIRPRRARQLKFSNHRHGSTIGISIILHNFASITGHFRSLDRDIWQHPPDKHRP